MRLWTIHPKYLDPIGLVALWREGLLAQAVLKGRTVGYRHHPQLSRFKVHPDPRAAILAYLWAVYDEALARGYRFDRDKLGRRCDAARIAETRGQLDFEWRHLKAKLRARNPQWLRRFARVTVVQPHPLMHIIPGSARTWEKSGLAARNSSFGTKRDATKS